MKIEINELRLGNVLKCRVSNDAGIYRVTALDWMGQKVMLDGARYETWYSAEKIKPIPLTPEILEKCGFAQYERVYILTGEQLSPCGESFKLLDLEDNGHFTHKNVHVQYLHQLQNLYFALTQTELPINL